MALNDFQIGLIASLDGTKSKHRLNQDIETLKKQLNNVEIQAKLGKDVVTNLTKQLNATQISLQNVSIDQNTINKMVDQINNALSGININIGSNVNNGLVQSAQNIGQQVGQQIQNGINQGLNNNSHILDSFRNSLKNIGMNPSQINTVANNIQNLGVQIETLNQSMSTTHGKHGDKDILSVDVSGIDKYGQAIKLTQKYNVDAATSTANLIKSIDSVATAQQKAGALTDTFVEKQKTAVTKAKNVLSSIQSEYNDKNVSKPIKNADNITNLNTQVRKVEKAITNLGNANKSTFTDMQNEVDTQISHLKDMIKEYRNAETVATSLRSKDIDTVKAQYSSKLDVLTDKMQSSGIYTDGFRNGAENLKSILSSATDASGLTQFLNGLDKLEAGFKRAKSASDEFNKSQKVGINVSGLESKIDNLKSLDPEIVKFTKEIAGSDVSIQSLCDDLSKVTTQGDFSVVKAKLNAFTEAAQAAGYQVKELADNGISSIQDSLNVGDYDVKVTKLENSFKSLGLESTEVAQKTEKVREALSNLKDPKSVDNLVENEKVFNSELKKSQNEAVQLKSQLDKIYNPNKQFRLSTDIQNWLSKNTRATTKAKQELESYYRELSSGKVSVDRLEYIEKALKRVDSQQRGFGKLGKNLKDQMSQAAESFTQWISISSTIMLGVSKFKEAVSELKELDDILTEISKTSDLTSTQLKKLGSIAFDSASKYGKSASDYLTGVQEMYRAGFKNAEQMSELSILAQSAGDMTADMSNDYLIATNAAYNLKGNIKDLNDVLDGQNYITNNAAVSMSDMAAATSEAASIASQYGVKIEELSSLIAVATAKTRESGSETGTALKSIFINLQDTTNKSIRKAFEAVGISMTEIVNGSEKLKTPIELLKELSQAFNSLPEGDTRRANILSDIGGKFYHVMQKCITRMNLIAGNALEPCTTI